MESKSNEVTVNNESKSIEENLKDLNLNSNEKKSSVPESATKVDGGSQGMVVTERTGINSLPPGYSSTSSQIDAIAYHMNHKHRGFCLIFNQSVFDKNTDLGDRNGSNTDRDNVSSLFRDLGFSTLIYNNLSVKGIKQILEKYAYEEDHMQHDCFVVVFMSHGENGNLYGRDSLFKAEDIYSMFTADLCPTLAGKPKMFFIQACRGDGLDPGRKMVMNRIPDEIDSGSSLYMYKIPNHADFLISWSTVPGHYSWRNTTNGSWFIQAIVKVFRTHANALDVLSMMTYVNRYMMINFESNCPGTPGMHSMKQSAAIVSTLTRLIILNPKQ